MSFIQYNQGCSDPGCWGPGSPYYTLFGTQFGDLVPYFVVSAVFGLILFGVLFALKKKGKLNLPFYWVIILSIAGFILSFLFLTYFFPSIPVY